MIVLYIAWLIAWLIARLIAWLHDWLIDGLLFVCLFPSNLYTYPFHAHIVATSRPSRHIHGDIGPVSPAFHRWCCAPMLIVGILPGVVAKMEDTRLFLLFVWTKHMAHFCYLKKRKVLTILVKLLYCRHLICTLAGIHKGVSPGLKLVLT